MTRRPHGSIPTPGRNGDSDAPEEPEVLDGRTGQVDGSRWPMPIPGQADRRPKQLGEPNLWLRKKAQDLAHQTLSLVRVENKLRMG